MHTTSILKIAYNGLDKMSAVHTGLGGGVQRINNNPLERLERNDRILFIFCYASYLFSQV